MLLLNQLLLFLQGVLVFTSSVNDLGSGDWGHVSFAVNPSKCYDVRWYSSVKYHQLYTAVCYSHSSFNQKSLEWRYDSNTHQLQNRGLTEAFQTPYCLAAETLSHNSKLWVVPCKGNIHFKFILRDELGGRTYQLVLEGNQRYCVEFYGSYARHSTSLSWGHVYSCQSWSTSSEQWINYVRTSNYNGPSLQPVVDPDFATGNWGTLKLRRDGKCLAVESVYLKLQTRECLDNDEATKFRYDPATFEIKSWKYPERTGGQGCVTANGRNHQLYVTRCTRSPAQKFIIKNGSMFTGIYQQLGCYGNNDCVYIHGGLRAYSSSCQRFSTTSTQFFEFNFWRSAQVCPAGQIPYGSDCVNCPAGTFSPVEGATTCHPCPTGKTSEAGATSCHFINECPAGTFMEEETGVCHLCPINTFSGDIGSTSCTRCPAGTHTKSTGSTSCVPNHNCPAGTFVNGAHGCTECPVNTFSNVANADTCNNCPEGMYTKSTGSTSCIRKTYCGPGKFHNGNRCQVCPRNTFDNTIGNTECTPCPEGYETKSTGATRCTRKNNCQAGRYFSETMNKCTPCPKNTFTDRAHQVECKKCPSGTGTKAEGATKCVRLNYCKAGKYHNGKRCIDCPKNTFSNEVGSWECDPCPHGTMTDSPGSTSCRKIVRNDCVPGTFYNGKVCAKCSKNTYSDQRGLKKCKECAKGYETRTTGSTYCTEKEDININASSDAETLKCKEGKVCLVKCRFSTNTGIKIKNKSNVAFYKLVGTNWQSIGPLGYNTKFDWFNVKVAQESDFADAGIYKCVARYGEAEGYAQIRVVIV